MQCWRQWHGLRCCVLHRRDTSSLHTHSQGAASASNTRESTAWTRTRAQPRISSACATGIIANGDGGCNIVTAAPLTRNKEATSEPNRVRAQHGPLPRHSLGHAVNELREVRVRAWHRLVSAYRPWRLQPCIAAISLASALMRNESHESVDAHKSTALALTKSQ